MNNPWDDVPRSIPDPKLFSEVVKVAVFAADAWHFSLRNTTRHQPVAIQLSSYLHEGLMHLVELGIVTIDAERLRQLEWCPLSREASRPEDQPL